MEKLELTNRTLKWNVIDGYGVSVIMTTTGFTEEEIREIAKDYKQKKKVDIQAFQQFVMNHKCLDNSKSCYITYM